MTVEATPPAATGSDDIVAVLLDQHEEIKARFADVHAATGPEKQARFDELRALLAVHETAEEMVLRPITRQIGAEDVADARNAEEKAANETLAKLEDLGVDHADFAALFEEFEADVVHHASSEESLEFPQIVANRSAEERAKLGKALRAVEATAPTHPHPTTAGSTAAQWVVGPFASMVDRAKDALTAALR
jgi:hypothetical protein